MIVFWTGGCGDDDRFELIVKVTGAKECAGICQVNRVDVFVLKPLEPLRWCVLDSRSFAPSGERLIEGIDLAPQSTMRLVILGYCGEKCYCEFDDTVVIDPQGPALSLPLQRDICHAPLYDPC